MIRFKRFVVVFSIVALAGMLAACTGQNSGSGANDQQKSEAAKPIKLEIIESGNGLPTPDKDIIKHELDKALNTDINLTVFASGEDLTNQLNVRMASGNFPDLFSVSKQQLQEFSKQGLLLDLTPFMDNELKPVSELIGQDSLKKSMVDGKVYAISKTPSIPYTTYWIRQDWLEKLNLKAPTTIEEFLAVAKAFTYDDPDGNGKKDTFGLTGSKYETFAPILGAFGVGGPDTFYVKDGKVINSLYDPGMKDALAYIREMIQAGVVDPEVLANTGFQYQEKAIKGQVGIVYATWSNMTQAVFADQIKAVNPNAKWVQLKAPVGPGGQYDGSWDIGTTSMRFAIPKALQKEPEKLKKIFELLNYVSSKDKGSYLVQFGVEGKHYNIENGKVVPTDLMGKEVSYSWLYQFTGRPEMEYLKTKYAEQTDLIEFAENEPRISSLSGFVDIPIGYNPSDAGRYIDEEFAKFINDKRPLSEYTNFLKTLGEKMNYQHYYDEAVKQLNMLGYGK